MCESPTLHQNSPISHSNELYLICQKSPKPCYFGPNYPRARLFQTNSQTSPVISRQQELNIQVICPKSAKACYFERANEWARLFPSKSQKNPVSHQKSPILFAKTIQNPASSDEQTTARKASWNPADIEPVHWKSAASTPAHSNCWKSESNLVGVNGYKSNKIVYTGSKPASKKLLGRIVQERISFHRLVWLCH